MTSFLPRRIPIRAILIQLAIIAGLVAFYKLCLPSMRRESAAKAAAEREQKIEEFFKFAVVEDTTGEAKTLAETGATRAYPQKLRRALSVEEVRQTLGLPDKNRTDFRGGQHLTWIGTAHTLEASFHVGRLYCLRKEDRATGHGVMVFESSWGWHPY